MKAYLLARVSSKEQEDNNSIPAQTRNLLEYSKKHNLAVIDTYQLVESSTKTNRKQFNELIDKINNSIETVALVTDTVDRLQRSFKESVILDEIRKAGKVELHFVRENLIITQNSNSSEILRWDIAVMFAKSYVTQLSDNVKRSTELKR
ncbi:MAG: recombinase family protein, partial [Ignavibacteria bacterium]|nr:recombinase family protein [Ignavibacteria bacterium]